MDPSCEGYVTATESGYYVTGTRVSLDSIVYAFPGGQTAEAIAPAFPVAGSHPERLLASAVAIRARSVVEFAVGSAS